MKSGVLRAVCTVYFFCLFFSLNQQAIAREKSVAMTMDDMPFNAIPSYYTFAEIKAINEKLLQKIASNKTPVGIFITGHGCLEPDNAGERLQLLENWVDNPWTTLGSHTVTHPDCSQLSPTEFQKEVTANEDIIRPISGSKPLRYFRFPFNSLGKDSLAQATMKKYLTDRGYTIAPFTVESVDYMFDALYNDALKKGDSLEAVSLARQYIDFTIQSFAYFEKLSAEIFGRNIKHIYLCHANRLNADYYNELISALQRAGYRCISLDEAMADSAYASRNYYYQRYGFSWLFRWIQDESRRKSLLRTSPDPAPELYGRYEALSREK